MENSIYIGLSRQIALRNNMSIVANNIANMNTTGFRGQNPIFKEYISDPRYNGDALSFVQDYGQYKKTAQGSIEQTDNPFNIALNGPGFMAIQAPDGSVGYTRDGNFQKDAQGTLVSSAGYPIMGQGGPITIPSNATEISIDEKGVISDQNGIIGQLQIVEFDNIQQLKPIGNNIYAYDGNTKNAEKTVVKQGFLEKSNVNPITEMTKMIEILRQYQSTQKLLEGEHERLRSAIRKLTQS